MSENSHVAAGSDLAMHVQAAGLFAQSERRNSTLGRLSGPMPKGEGSAAETIRKQSSTDMPIVKAQDLSRGKGDEVEFHFLQPTKMRPIMGSKNAEGQGQGLSYEKSRIRVDQARIPINVGDTMTGLRSAVDFRRLGRPVVQAHMDAYLDQSILVHLAGARGFQDNAEWRVPLASHPDFAEMLVNPVKAPTKNRHYIADGTNGLQPFSETSGVVDLATTDVLDMGVVDAVRTLVESISLPPPAVKIPGDVVAEDSPLRVLLVSPAQYHAFAADDDFRKFQVAAMNRASKAKNHPLFMGECGIWNGILIMKMPKPIRFYAGDSISYCASHTSQTESVATVNANFSTTHAVDRAILLGGQALAQAFAASGHGGMPMFWKEKQYDFDDKRELMVGIIQGLEKLRWNVDQTNGQKHWTDHGVIAIDTAVKIIAGERG